MSRSESRENSATVSLFPFLAVLLCTMGGLVVLLVAMSHASREIAKRSQAVEQQTPAQPPQDEAVKQELAELLAYTARLRQAEEQFTAHAQREKARIAAAEAHLRKLQQEGELLAASLEELDNKESQHYDDRAQAERELARLERLIADTETEVEQLKLEQEGRQQSYSIVPYVGSGGTRRQPIYIECLQDKVVIQPEGVELTPVDFAEPLGVGNPLAAALRAARDHLVRDNPDAGIDPDAEPYPLIVVRPEGVGAYYKVRSAIKSWDSDFGYELVGQDWNLNYPPPDSQLATLVTRAIENARMRRSILAAAAPSAFGGNAGAFAVDDGGRGGAGQGPYDPGVISDQGLGDGGETAQNPWASSAGAPGGDPASVANVGQSTDASPYSSSAPSGAGGPFGMADGALSGGAESMQQQGNGGPGAVPGAASEQGADKMQEPAQQAGGALAAANGSGQPGASPSSQSKSFSVGTTGSGAGSSSSMASLNDREGPDDVAIRRPVTVTVFADRVLIGKEGRSVSLSGETAQDLSQVAGAIKGQIKSWGLAGKGLYWRPVIKLEVRPGGQQHAQQIYNAMQSSGVDVSPVRTASEEAPFETR